MTSVKRLPKSEKPKVDFSQLDALFSSRENNSNSSVGENTPVFDRSSNKRDTVNLLSSKRSLNVNIFLRQFRGNNAVQSLLDNLKEGNSAEIGLEKLRSLLKILPDKQEIELLSSYTGEISRLGNAEQFFDDLIKLNNYSLRVDCMVLKEEYNSIVDSIRPAIESIKTAAEELRSSGTLQEMLILLLQVGNYLNWGGYGGNAAGFRLNSLWKVAELRANRNNINMFHFIANQAKGSDKLADELPHLESASKLSLETMKAEVRSLSTESKRISQKLRSIINTADLFLAHMTEFLVILDQNVASIEDDFNALNATRLSLADFFCENAKTFKLEECFKIFHIFVCQISKAVEENKERKAREDRVSPPQVSHSVSASDLSAPSLLHFLHQSPAAEKENSFARTGSLRRTSSRRSASHFPHTAPDRDRSSSSFAQTIVGRNRIGSARSDAGDDQQVEEDEESGGRRQRPLAARKRLDSARHSNDLADWLSVVENGKRPKTPDLSDNDTELDDHLIEKSWKTIEKSAREIGQMAKTADDRKFSSSANNAKELVTGKKDTEGQSVAPRQTNEQDEGFETASLSTNGSLPRSSPDEQQQQDKDASGTGQQAQEPPTNPSYLQPTTSSNRRRSSTGLLEMSVAVESPEKAVWKSSLPTSGTCSRKNSNNTSTTKSLATTVNRKLSAPIASKHNKGEQSKTTLVKHRPLANERNRPAASIANKPDARHIASTRENREQPKRVVKRELCLNVRGAFGRQTLSSVKSRSTKQSCIAPPQHKLSTSSRPSLIGTGVVQPIKQPWR